MKFIKPFLFIFCMFFVFFSSTLPSHAAGDTEKIKTASYEVTQVICNVINLIQGPTGKTIAILVVISLAIGLFLGKITWGVAIAVAVGMGVLFGANTVVGYVAGDGGNPCNDGGGSGKNTGGGANPKP